MKTYKKLNLLILGLVLSVSSNTIIAMDSGERPAKRQRVVLMERLAAGFASFSSWFRTSVPEAPQQATSSNNSTPAEEPQETPIDFDDQNQVYAIALEAVKNSNEQLLKEIILKSNFILLKNHYKSELGTESSLLHIAVKKGNTQIMKLLLEHVLDKKLLNVIINDFDNLFKIRPLHVAIINKNYDALNMLLEYGADFSWCITQDGLFPEETLMLTPLYLAVRSNSKQIVERLLELGNININEECNDFCMQETNYYPLHLAAKNGNVEIIKLLLGAGAKKYLKNSNNETAADVAYAHGHKMLGDFIAGYKK